MNVLTCEYVEASEVFKNCPEAWEFFAASDPDCTWGSNNRTLVTPDVIAVSLEEGDQTKQVKTVLRRLKKLGQTYIDLEN